MGSWGIGPFDNDDAGEALIELNSCETNNEFTAKILKFLQYHHSDDFDEDDEYKAIASSAVVYLFMEKREFETQKQDFLEHNPFRFHMPADFQSVKNKFSDASLVALVPNALEALLKTSRATSYVYELRNGDIKWLGMLNELCAKLRNISPPLD